MDQLITGLVDRVLLPVIDAFIPMITNGVAFIVFVLIWGAFAYALIASRGSLDAAWHWVRALPFVVQAVVWLLFLPAVVVVPGLIALVSVPGLGGSNPDLAYNNAVPLLIGRYLPEGMLGIAVTGLLAAFMAGVAANVTAFNTVFTYDLWQ